MSRQKATVRLLSTLSWEPPWSISWYIPSRDQWYNRRWGHLWVTGGTYHGQLSRPDKYALYGFLCNKDVIPQEFTFAQNCIKSFSSTMDGFQTLMRMLVLVHPLLNNRRPPNEMPLLSDSAGFHLYEQEMLNYYLLHEIYGRSEYIALDKSKQFLDGLDGDKYEIERTRLTAILDAVKLNNAELQMKHHITSLANTTMNMKNKNNVSKTMDI